MIDIEDAAARAIEAPVAPPPELARVESLARRLRRRRTVVRATTGVTAVALAVAIGAAVIGPGDSDGVKVVTTSPSPTVPSTTTVAPAPGTLDALISRLEVDHEVVQEGSAPGSPMGVPADLLCVDGTRVSVYEYPDNAARAAVSDTISPDGSQIGEGRISIVDWIGPPHFYASGRIIVLVLVDDIPLLDWLTRELGATLSPEARSGASAARCSASATTSSAAP